ncbi:hypothetical protein [Streptomyces gardneri]|uniref:Uncharacterized protein n=1 Tax=Streptomyces gardneri TaxID=66892 RepID=A0A4Y3RGW7_9ACTN|nr:hypothetical protein SGA01_26560 [Streptomyces gardneri]GHH16763.1 hypothetical protein GCM10017674_67050 [Streptomyces gardneri]
MPVEFPWVARLATNSVSESPMGLGPVSALSAVGQSPAKWFSPPPLPDAHCRYIGEWTATKLRWGLAADQAEADALKVYAEGV